MSRFAALARRELGTYFVSPMAYIILTALLFLAAAGFCSAIQDAVRYQVPFAYAGTLHLILGVVIFTSALITMRLLAEEKSRGTLEIMLTAPISEAGFVLAKFAASVVLLGYILLPTVGFAVIVSQYGPVDAGAVACGYLGVLLIGAMVYSIGLFISSLCSRQTTAGILTFAVSFVLLVSTLFAQYLPREWVLRRFLAVLDLNANFGDFLLGVLDLPRLVLLASVTVFFLFLTVRVVESRRWR